MEDLLSWPYVARTGGVPHLMDGKSTRAVEHE